MPIGISNTHRPTVHAPHRLRQYAVSEESGHAHPRLVGFEKNPRCKAGEDQKDRSVKGGNAYDGMGMGNDVSGVDSLGPYL